MNISANTPVRSASANASTAANSSDRHQTNVSSGERVGESGERSEVEVFTTDVSGQGE